MSEKANLAVIEAMWLAWNQKRLNGAADLVAEDAHFRHFTLGIELHGREAIVDLMERSLAVFLERRSTVLHNHAADDYVIAEHHCETVRSDSDEPLTKDICCGFQREDQRAECAALKHRARSPGVMTNHAWA